MQAKTGVVDEHVYGRAGGLELIVEAAAARRRVRRSMAITSTCTPYCAVISCCTTTRRSSPRWPRKGFAPTEVTLILLTDAHSDHAAAPPVCARPRARRLPSTTAIWPCCAAATTARSFPPTSKPHQPALREQAIPRWSPTSSWMTRAISARWGWSELLPTPGHSPGSISMLFANGDAIIGDILRGGIMGGAFLAGGPTTPSFCTTWPTSGDPGERAARARRRRERLYAGHGGPRRAPWWPSGWKNKAGQRGLADDEY